MFYGEEAATRDFIHWSSQMHVQKKEILHLQSTWHVEELQSALLLPHLQSPQRVASGPVRTQRCRRRDSTASAFADCTKQVFPLSVFATSSSVHPVKWNCFFLEASPLAYRTSRAQVPATERKTVCTNTQLVKSAVGAGICHV